MRRTLAILVVIAVLFILGAFWLQGRRHRAELTRIETANAERLQRTHEDSRALARQLALEIARALAMTIADDVARNQYAALESQLATLVRGGRIVSAMVLDRRGTVVVATDRRFAGQTLTDAPAQRALQTAQVSIVDEDENTGQVEVVAPLAVGSERVGALRLFIQIGESRQIE